MLFIRTLPDHRLIDRLVRGRSWIPLLGVLLAGIVAMQVELLKLNAGIGRSIDLSSALQSRNDLLRASISSLSDPQRIEHLASGLGMVMPGPTSILFLDASHASAAKAAASIQAPDPAAFQSSLAASAAAAQTQSNDGSTSSTPAAAGPSSPATSVASPAPASVSPPTASSPTTSVGSGTSSSATGPPSVAPSEAAGAGVTGGQSPTGSP